MPLTERLSSRVAAEALALAGSEPRGVPAVIDTNVVLDLIYWEDPHSEDLRRALEEGRIHALRSGEAVMELAEVLSRPAFTGDEDEAARLAALWCSMSVPVDEEKIREAADVITVVKSDAYGHGLEPMAAALSRAGAVPAVSAPVPAGLAGW